MLALTTAAAVVAIASAAPCGPPPPRVSRAHRLREYRETIVSLYRVPERHETDPLDQLRHSLAEQYGPPAIATAPD